MATNYKQRLESLRTRRTGQSPGGLTLAAFDSAEGLYKSQRLEEAYERRSDKDALKYALGAMQAVDEQFTKTSYEEGDRVKNHIERALNAGRTRVAFEYQGSVPLDIHIRGFSDIDMLVLAYEFVTYDAYGPAAHTYTRLPGLAVDGVTEIREDCENGLEGKFPAATLDVDGTKSIALYGGSLRRKVDVVPAVWHDTAEYQKTRQKHDREVRVLDTSGPELLTNRPFLHMKRIEDLDALAAGGAKKTIRLLKNLKKDRAGEIALSSYDIASLVWHIPSGEMKRPNYLEASLIATAQAHLRFWANNKAAAMRLECPDGSRKICDTEERFEGLVALAQELDALARDIAIELNPLAPYLSDGVRKALTEAIA